MSKRTLPVSSLSSKREDNPYDLPSQYEFLEVLGGGGFGIVLRCLKKKTQERVAIKIPMYEDVKEEAIILKRFMRNSFDQHNIVKCLDSFNTRYGKALVFEELDITLKDYFANNQFRPLPMSEIRSIIRQMATALEAMKRMRVIHTDIKLNNIMLVDRQKRPFEIKLIDFGLATPVQKAEQGTKMQVEEFRAPEVVLGLPLTEAIDMWSLGCVMTMIVGGGLLFTGSCGYELMQCFIHLLGQPPDRLLNRGMYTERYFIRTKTNAWRLKTPTEYWGLRVNDRNFLLSSLDQLKTVRYQRLDITDDLEWERCLDLLKAMLRLDPAQRITPRQVLSHPFIVRTHVDDTSRNSISPKTSTCKDSDTLSPPATDNAPQVDNEQKESTHSVLPQVDETSRHVPGTSKDCDSLSSAATPEDNRTTNVQPDDHGASPVTSDDVFWSQFSRPLVVHIQPAPPDNTGQLEDLDSLQTKTLEPFVTGRDDNNNNMRDTKQDILMSEDSITCGEKLPPLPSSPVSQLRPKKKKNCFQRFYSWMRKNFRSCMTSVDEEETSDSI